VVPKQVAQSVYQHFNKTDVTDDQKEKGKSVCE
jgi:hypothetical protein